MVSMSIVHQTCESYEIYGYIGPSPLLVTCEHASNRIPAPLRTSKMDREWLATHWGWDIGARTVCRELIRQTHSIGVFSRFSRLLADANRDPNHETLVRCAVEGHILSFNSRLTIEEVDRRIERYHVPYHAAVDRTMADRQKHPGEVMLLSVHSFTPQLGSEKRTMDVGVLFDHHEPVARRLQVEIAAEGLRVELNQPYSGRNGLMYAAHLHGSSHGAAHLELELNQALLSTPADARKMGRILSRALGRMRLRQNQS
jgi:predicted N-formylglutamate amidohydrolase